MRISRGSAIGVWALRLGSEGLVPATGAEVFRLFPWRPFCSFALLTVLTSFPCFFLVWAKRDKKIRAELIPHGFGKACFETVVFHFFEVF